MAGKYKRYYIPVGGTLLSIFLMLTIIGVQISSDGDKVCSGTIEDPCISYITVSNPTAKSVYIYNYDEVTLEFSPDIERYELYVKYYGKWRYTNFTMETRLGNIPKDRKYVFVFPRYAKKEFKLVGYKNNPSDIVKWTLGVPGDILDPVWDSDKDKDKIKLKEIDITEEYNVTVDHPYYTHTYNCYDSGNVTNGTQVQCGEELCPIDWSCNDTATYHHNYTNETRERVIGTYQQLEIQGEAFNVTEQFCAKEGQIITCDSTLDGNYDGKIQPGESGTVYEVKDATYNAVDHYEKKYIKELKGYNVTWKDK